MCAPRRGLRSRSGEMMSQKPLHPGIVKSAIGDVHADAKKDCALVGFITLRVYATPPAY